MKTERIKTHETSVAVKHNQRPCCLFGKRPSVEEEEGEDLGVDRPNIAENAMRRERCERDPSSARPSASSVFSGQTEIALVRMW
jgi:hypothetical protein